MKNAFCFPILLVIALTQIGSVLGKDSPGALNQHPEVEALKFKLKVALEESSKSLKTLERKYQEQLAALRKKSVAAANLEQVLVVEKEAAAPGTVSAEDVELRKIQKIYLAERKRRQSAQAKKDIDIYKGYGKAVRSLRDSLTKQDKIEAAKLADIEAKHAAEFIQKSGGGSGKAEEKDGKDKVDNEALLAELEKKWHPAIWIHPKWLSEKWDRMKLEPASEDGGETDSKGIVVTNTSGAHTFAHIIYNDEFKRRSNFEISVTVTGDQCGFGIMTTSAGNGGVSIKRSKLVEPTEFKIRCKEKKITFHIDGEEVKPGAYEMDHRTVEKFRVAIKIKDEAQLTIHDFKYQRLKR